MSCWNKRDYLSSMDACPTKMFSDQFRSPIAEIFAVWPALVHHLDDEGQKSADAIQYELYRMLRNVKNIELYNKLTATYFEFETVDVVSLVDCVRTSVRDVCRVDIGGRSHSEPILVRGHKRFLTHTLLGVVRNSLSYSRDGSRIDISVGKTANRAIIKIHDSGKGMKPQYQAQAFDPFFSVDPYGDDPAAPGLGLDLAILHRLMQHLEGRAFINSEYGKENTVGISIPYIESTDEAGDVLSCNASELLADRFSSLYLQLSGFCRLPN